MREGLFGIGFVIIVMLLLYQFVIFPTLVSLGM